MSTATPPWICPVCRAPLAPQGRCLRCPSGHSFDLAREGYVNLLLANRKHSADPGDDRMMSRSRRAFLDQGYYAPLAHRLAGLCRAWLGASGVSGRIALLDMGCGEGYYTHQLQHDLAAGAPGDGAALDIAIAGVDISREALRMAAKRYREIPFAVASNSQLPVAEQSQTILTAVFAPVYPEEMLRILQPGGLLLHVRPGPEHLFSLRRLVYDQPRPHEEKSPRFPGFTPLVSERLTRSLQVSGDDLQHLLAMTPYFWQTSREKQQRIAQLPGLETTLDMVIDQFVT